MARPRLRGVRARTTLSAVAVVAVALVLAAVLLLALLQRSLVGSAESAVRQRAVDVAGLVADEPGSLDDVVGRDIATTASPGDTATLVQVLDASGRVEAASASLAGRPALLGVRDWRDGDSGEVDLPGRDDPWAVAVRDVDAGPDRTRVVAARSLDGVETSVRTTGLLLAGGLPLVLAVVAAVAWRTAGRALAPVEAIRTQVSGITTGTLGARVPEPGTGDEVARLAVTMNAMLTRVEHAQAAQRRFVADAGHELRNPLASVRSAVEVRLAPDHPTTRRVLADVDRLSALVDDLLLLATADEGRLDLGSHDVDLDDLLAEEQARLVREDGPAVEATLTPVRVQGDPRRLHRAVRNLVDNAARHASSRVRLACRVEDGHAILTVDDDGPGVPAVERTRVFDRFTRLDEGRARDAGGSGLGLAIVREVVTASGGTVVCVDADGGGARFVVRLPLRPDATPDPQPPSSASR